MTNLQHASDSSKPLIHGDAFEGEPDSDTSFDFGENAPAEQSAIDPALLAAYRQFADAAEGPPDTGDVLREVQEYIRRYVVLDTPKLLLCAAWIMATWCVGTFDLVPYLWIFAPEKAAGKSTLLDSMEQLVCNPLPSGGGTPAALLRKLDEKTQTLLLDELDALLGGNKETGEDIRGILNNGFRRGKVYMKCDGRENKVRSFAAFGFKVFAGINNGQMWDTVASRSIPIELRRKTRDEHVERFLRRDYEPRAVPLRERLAAWSEASVRIIPTIEPVPIHQLSDRANDISEPLLQIGELTGDARLASAIRKALIVTFGEAAENQESSTGENLLADTRTVFESAGLDRISTKDLIERLCGLEESPWAEWNRGNPMSPKQLGMRLRKFGIHPRNARFGGGQAKAYHVADFAESWKRYLPEAKAAA